MAYQIIMPKASMSMEEGTIIQWFKQEGDEVKTGDPLLEIETDKISMDVEAEASGTLLKILCQEGDVVKVADIIGYIGEPGEQIKEKSSTPEKASEQPQKPLPVATGANTHSPALVEKPNKPAATPRARSLAATYQVDLTTITGSGPHGEIRAKDIQGKQGVWRIKMSSMRRAIARNMTESYQQIPQVTLNMTADVTDLLKYHTELMHQEKKKYSINDFIVAAVAQALSESPDITVSLENNIIIYKNSVNIGIAIAVENGLVVPIVQDADTLKLDDLSQAIKRLTEQAKTGKLSPDQLTGGTFTVSNLGMYGISSFNPIINPGESAILGVCAVYDTLKIISNSVETRNLIELCLTVDHRVIDGALGGVFLKKIKLLLEEPEKLGK